MKRIQLDVLLKCPDGLCESAGFFLPDDLQEFLDYINIGYDNKDYSVCVKRSKQFGV